MRRFFSLTVLCLCLCGAASAQQRDVQIQSTSRLTAADIEESGNRWKVALQRAWEADMDTVIIRRFVLSGTDAASGKKTAQLTGTNRSGSLKISSLLFEKGKNQALYPEAAPEATVVICTGCSRDAMPQWNGKAWSCGTSSTSTGNCRKITVAMTSE